MALPDNMVLINRRCPPGCTACPPGADPTCAPADAAQVLRTWENRADVGYVGMEALAEPEILPDLVRQAAAQGVRPILLTRGGPELPLPRISAVLRTLADHGPFELLLALDNEHFDRLAPGMLGGLLHVLTNSTPAELHVLFVLPPNTGLPAELLQAEEVNRGALIVTRTGRSLADYLHRCAPGRVDIARPVGQSVGRPRRTDPATAYPVSFQALIFQTTYFCNTRCSHCHSACGSESAQRKLAVSEVCRVIDQAAVLPNIGPRCHFSGGEATIYWHELIAMLAHSARRGFINTIATNGFWGISPQKARRKVGELFSVGVRSIELSADAIHHDFITARVLSNIIRAGKEHGVDIVLRVCTTRRSRLGDVLGALDPRDQRDIVLVADVSTGTGRATSGVVSQERWQLPGIPSGACADMLNLVVTPNGTVYPCGNGSELCETLSLGNVRGHGLAAIMGELRSNVLLRTLIHAGPGYFAELMADSELAHKLRPAYGSFCELCTQIFTDPEMTAFVWEHVQRRTREAQLATAGPA